MGEPVMSERGTNNITKAAEEHHAELWAELTARVYAVIEAVARGADPEPSRGELLDYLTREVVPHLRTEERMVYNLARGAGERGLVAAMELDHRALLRQVESIKKAVTPLEAAMAARAFLVLFALRMEKEEKVLLPVLAERGLDVRELLEGRPEIVGTPSPG
jgi:iron-sulfur cluster repair protein YtfE (RIC family)